jgi:plasmid stabilization system protein ParE
MRRNSGYGLHPLAAKDITAIWEYIAADNPRAAGRVREELIEKIRSLVAFPHQGLRRLELTTLPLRFKTVREYVIAYAPDKKPLWVVAVFHGRRDPGVIALMLEDREQ